MARLEINNALWKALYKSNDESMKDLMSFAFGLPVTNNPAGYVDVGNITNYSELSFAGAKGLHALGVRVFEYPLFAYCAQAELDEDVPACLYTPPEGEDTISLNQWLANQHYTTQLLSNGSYGFGLDWSKVTFEQALALDVLEEFTVIDTPTYIGLLPTEDI